MRLFARSVLLGAVAVVAACALPSREEFASGTGEKPGAPVDGGTHGDGASLIAADGTAPQKDGAIEAIAPVDAGTDAAPPYVLPADNLLPPNNADFEQGCDDAGGYESKIMRDGSAHGGSASCRVCHVNTNDNIFSMDNGFDTRPTVGETYRATAWVKHAGSAPLHMVIALRSQAADYAQIEVAESDSVIAGDDWQQISVDLTLTKQAKLMDTYTYGYADGGAKPDNCFLIDDYAVTRVK